MQGELCKVDTLPGRRYVGMHEPHLFHIISQQGRKKNSLTLTLFFVPQFPFRRPSIPSFNPSNFFTPNSPTSLLQPSLLQSSLLHSQLFNPPSFNPPSFTPNSSTLPPSILPPSLPTLQSSLLHSQLYNPPSF